MMKRTQIALMAVLLFCFGTGCTTQQINAALKQAQDALGNSPLTEQEVAQGLKEALEKGIVTGANLASRTNGYWQNPDIRIPLPPEIREIESRARAIGLGDEVDKILLNINRGAEAAASEAKPIFVSAIRSMSVQDAWGILRGSNDEATTYLRRRTYNDLKLAFAPHIEQALERTLATKYYTDVVNGYNRIPGVQKIDPNLESFVTAKALDGLFLLVAEEEARIRRDPVARTTELLKKVFDEKNQNG